MPKPNNPKPATDIPITAPPEKATFNALVIPPSMAALAVLVFALVAIFIPVKPANPEQIAPTTKDKLVIGLLTQPNIRLTIIIKNTKTLYSLFKKVIAPRSIIFDISCINSFPGFSLITFRERNAANIRAMMPLKGINSSICILFYPFFLCLFVIFLFKCIGRCIKYTPIHFCFKF
ncbi:hypothetical protein ES708_26213 [subsurface metagenome]